MGRTFNFQYDTKPPQEKPPIAYVKRASEIVGLNSLRGIGVSSNTIHYIQDKRRSLDEIVKLARDYTYKTSTQEDVIHFIWLDDVSGKLDAAGYIRHDLKPTAFQVSKLYQKVYDVYSDAPMEYYCSYAELDTNKKYEECYSIGEEKLQEINQFLMENLSEREFEVIKLRYGLDGKPHTYTKLAEACNLSTPWVYQAVHNAIRKLAETKLPALT